MHDDTLRVAANDALRLFDWLERRTIYTDADFVGVHQRLREALAKPQRGPLDRNEMNNVCRDAQIDFCLGKHPSYDEALIRGIEAKLGITPTTKEAVNG